MKGVNAQLERLLACRITACGTEAGSKLGLYGSVEQLLSEGR